MSAYIVLTEDNQGQLATLPGQFESIDDACDLVSFREHPGAFRFHIAQLAVSIGPVGEPAPG